MRRGGRGGGGAACAEGRRPQGAEDPARGERGAGLKPLGDGRLPRPVPVSGGGGYRLLLGVYQGQLICAGQLVPISFCGFSWDVSLGACRRPVDVGAGGLPADSRLLVGDVHQFPLVERTVTLRPLDEIPRAFEFGCAASRSWHGSPWGQGRGVQRRSWQPAVRGRSAGGQRPADVAATAATRRAFIGQPLDSGVECALLPFRKTDSFLPTIDRKKFTP